MLDALGAALTAEGVKLMLSAPVRRVRRDGDQLAVDDRPSARERFDEVVVTTNSHLAADLCPDLTRRGSGPAAVRAVHGHRVRVAGAAQAAGALLPDLHHRPRHAVHRRRGDDGVRRPGRDGRPHTSCTCPKYVAPDDPLFDAERRRGPSQLPALPPADVPRRCATTTSLAFRVSRVRRVFAVPTLGYSARMPSMTTSVPGLHLAGSAQLPFATLNVNDTLGLVAGAPPMKPLASLSLDLDNLWAYQMTHGDEGWDDYGSYLDTLVPLVLDRLAAERLRITFFVVGQDAALDRNEKAIRRARRGRPRDRQPLVPPPALAPPLHARRDPRRSWRRAEDAIEAVTGRRTVGFRGPGYSLSADVLRVLVDRGYRYDCSTLPTVIGPLARKYYFRSAQADGRAAGRAGLPVRRLPGGPAAAQALPVGGRRRPPARDPGHHDAVGPDPDARELRAVPRRAVAGAGPPVLRQRHAAVPAGRRRAVDPAPPARLPRRRRRRRPRLLPRHGHDRVTASGRSWPTACASCNRQFRVVPMAEHADAIAARGGLAVKPSADATPVLERA